MKVIFDYVKEENGEWRVEIKPSDLFVLEEKDILVATNLLKYIDAYNPDWQKKKTYVPEDVTINTETDVELIKWLDGWIDTYTDRAKSHREMGGEWVAISQEEQGKAGGLTRVKTHIENENAVRSACKPTETTEPEKCLEKCNSYICQREKGHKGNHENYKYPVYWRNQSNNEIYVMIYSKDTSIEVKEHIENKLKSTCNTESTEPVKCEHCGEEIFYKTENDTHWLHKSNQHQHCNFSTCDVAEPRTKGYHDVDEFYQNDSEKKESKFTQEMITFSELISRNADGELEISDEFKDVIKKTINEKKIGIRRDINPAGDVTFMAQSECDDSSA